MTNDFCDQRYVILHFNKNVDDIPIEHDTVFPARAKGNNSEANELGSSLWQ